MADTSSGQPKSQTKAQAAKDNGNIAFKSGDYPTAIGHYTTAILANKSDVTYPLNRAAAYLKLGKNEDAERDCTRVLELSSDNVKALFRRSQARTGMGNLTEARKDLLKVLKIEPSNQSAQEELKKVSSLIEKEKSKKSNHHQVPISPMQASLESSSAIKRRRVPIKIIEPSSAAASTTLSAVPVPSPSKSPVVELSSRAVRPASSNARTDTLEPESSHSLKLPAMDASSGNSKVSSTTGSDLTDDDEKESPEGNRTFLTPTLPSSTNSKGGASKQNSFKDAKQARESAKPSRVGGGIFRASGSNTLFTPRDNGNPTLADPPKSDSSTSIRPSAKNDDSNSQKTSFMPVPKAPNTLFDFVKSWGSLGSTEEKWQLIISIPPARFPALCKTSLEPSMLVSILETFLATLEVTKGDSGAKRIIQEYMENFARIPRFNTLVLFLSKSEKLLAKSVWMAVDVDQPTGVWRGVI